MAKIIFTDIQNPEGVLQKPKPASEYIPQWYKDARGYTSPTGKKEPRLDGSGPTTVKRCMPVWDMMTAGYIIETPYDIYVTQTPTGPHFHWGEMTAVVFQSMEMTQNHPYFRDISYAVRVVNPWSIKTPKGWSIMVIEPQHREPGPIVVSSGIVDTDESPMPFNIFLKLKDPNFEGMIPQGTPLIQVIPFKRESWVSALGGEKEKKQYASDLRKFTIILLDNYRRLWWKRKEYK